MINYTLPALILTLSYMQTRKMFLKYHEEMFKEQKKPLQIYFVFDFVGYALLTICAVIYIVFSSNVAN